MSRGLSVRTTYLRSVDWDDIVETYVAADVFALLSQHEPWAVVVNEAAACGFPLVLSDQVGAAHDLLEDSVNGFLVPAHHSEESAAVLCKCCATTTRFALRLDNVRER